MMTQKVEKRGQQKQDSERGEGGCCVFVSVFQCACMRVCVCMCICTCLSACAHAVWMFTISVFPHFQACNHSGIRTNIIFNLTRSTTPMHITIIRFSKNAFQQNIRTVKFADDSTGCKITNTITQICWLYHLSFLPFSLSLGTIQSSLISHDVLCCTLFLQKRAILPAFFSSRATHKSFVRHDGLGNDDRLRLFRLIEIYRLSRHFRDGLSNVHIQTSIINSWDHDRYDRGRHWYGLLWPVGFLDHCILVTASEAFVVVDWVHTGHHFRRLQNPITLNTSGQDCVATVLHCHNIIVLTKVKA